MAKNTRITAILLFTVITATILAIMSHSTSAHEVYVLNSSQINKDVHEHSPNPFNAIIHDEALFFHWATIIFLGVVAALIISLSRKLEKRFNPWLVKLKDYAPLAARLTLGICFISSGVFGGLFGPELPLSAIFGSYAHLVSYMFIISGIMIMIGFYTRMFVLITLTAFIIGVINYGTYMLTYINYLGEIIFILMLGAHTYSADYLLVKKKRTKKRFISVRKYSFLILRILFGMSLIFSAFYAKFFHSELALQTVAEYHLTNFFPFAPLFLVLGALMVESLMGLFFALGLDIRITAISFMTFILLSLMYFGEAVWPHFILFGVSIALFMHGYDDYTVEKQMFKKFWHNDNEPLF